MTLKATTAFAVAALSACGGAAARAAAPCRDHLVCPLGAAAPVELTPWTLGALSGVALGNGLLSRRFVTSASGTPVFATLDFRTFLDDVRDAGAASGAGTSLLRALSPEARLVVGGASVDVGGVDAAGRAGAPRFSLVANNSQAPCTFVAQGPTASLDACLAACWSDATCNTVDWIPAGGADCVLKSCADPANPPLQPLAGCFVYTTTAAAHASLAHGPFLNRSGIEAPGVLAPWPGALVPLGPASSAPPAARFAWTPGRRGSSNSTPWPPRGLALSASFGGAPGSALEGLNVTVTYEMYEGVAALTKWLTVEDGSAGVRGPWLLDDTIVEVLALNQPFAPLAPLAYASQYEDSATPPLFRATGKLGVLVDLHYASWVNYTDEANAFGPPGSSQPVLTVSELPGLGVKIGGGGGGGGGGGSGGRWTSPRAYELLFDDGPEQGAAVPLYPSSETYYGCTLGPCTPGTGSAAEGGFTERRGIALRRLLQTIAPQMSESPLQNHITTSDSDSVRAACAATAEAGFEMLVLGYGSGFDAETDDPAYMARVAADVAFCRANFSVEVGGYDLIGWTRDPGRGWAALAPGGADSGDACFASGWEAFLGEHFTRLLNSSGVTVFETDGPYAGYGCSNSSHQHGGVANSIALQSRAMGALYGQLQSLGVYVNAPDSWAGITGESLSTPPNPSSLTAACILTPSPRRAPSAQASKELATTRGLLGSAISTPRRSFSVR